MDFDITWMLLGLPVAFALGWLASRMDLRQMRLENRQAPKAYFKGLNFLLNEQQDQAIDAFIEAVQNDPDTSELHFALGNLFRRRGEYERAVRVHEHLLSRGDLKPAEHDRAQYALALDFLRAGLLDRAEAALNKLEGSAFAPQARLALLSIYERAHDWTPAAGVARNLQADGAASFAGRLAHYQCEQAQLQLQAGHADPARRLLQQAIDDAPQAARPRMELARLQVAQGQPEQAHDTLMALAQAAPAFLPLAVASLVALAIQCQRIAPTRAALLAHYGQTPCIDVLEGLIALDKATGQPSALPWYEQHLAQEPSLLAATRWVAAQQQTRGPDAAQPHVQRALDHAAKPLARYRCAACGFEASSHFWQCPGCQAWDSYPPRRIEEL